MFPNYTTPPIYTKVFEKHGHVDIVDKLEGSILGGRFQIGKYLTEGGFGKIYTAVDMFTFANGEPKHVIVKLTRNHHISNHEF